MYPDVPNELAGLLEGLSTVVAAVGETAAVDVFLVISGTRGEGPAARGGGQIKGSTQMTFAAESFSAFIETLYSPFTRWNKEIQRAPP